ncbi:MAG: site-specific integrase [Planctomycetes bacterium]|nr:site-specific integrase [Planctomycetota bacterium]
MAAAPFTREEAPDVDPQLLTVYFNKIAEVVKEPDDVTDEALPGPLSSAKVTQKFLVTPDGKMTDFEKIAKSFDFYDDKRRLTLTGANGKQVVNYSPKQQAVAALLKNVHDLRTTLARERKGKAALQRQVEELQRALGNRTDAERAITLEVAYEHFSRHLKSNTRDRILHRVNKVIQAIGPKRTWADLTSGKVTSVIDALPRIGDTERAYTTREFKRFCKFICLPKQHDGLGLATNPCEVLPVPSTTTLAKKRIDRKGVALLDPNDYVGNNAIPLYWRALIAVMGYAGARLSEAATLKWSDVDEKARIIELHPDPAFRPNSKTHKGRRSIPPFPEIWPVLRKFKKQAKHSEWVFPNPLGNCWREKMESDEFSTAFVGAVGHEIPEKHRAYALRHWWETEMRKAGLGDLIDSTGGHSAQVGRLFYTESRELVRQAARKGMPKTAKSRRRG